MLNFNLLDVSKYAVDHIKNQIEDPQNKNQIEDPQNKNQIEDPQNKNQIEDPQNKNQIEDPQNKNQTEDPQNKNQTEDPNLSFHDYTEQIKKSIESSKVFIGSIIDNIRNKGKIKIINTPNNNPTHPSTISSFPDLINITQKTSNPQNDYRAFERFDEKFDVEGRKKIINTDKNFKNRMNASIQKTYYKNFLNDDEWHVSNYSKSLDNINYTIRKFKEKYEYLKFANTFEESFMVDSNPFLFVVNDNVIPINTREKMLASFEKVIPNIEHRRLISTYANKKFLRQSYLQLLAEHPEINQYKLKNTKNTYQIQYINNGSIKLVATHVSDLDPKNNNDIKKYQYCGTRATIILSLNHPPIMKYSYFLKT